MDRWKRLFAGEEGQIVGQVIKYGLIFAVIILIIVEVGPLLINRVTIQQDGQDIAEAAAFQYTHGGGNFDMVRDAVVEEMRTMGYKENEISETVASIKLLPEGSSQKEKVQVTVVRYANTLLTRNIKQLKKYSRIAATKEATIATSGK